MDTCSECGTVENVEHFLLLYGSELALCCDCYRKSTWYREHTCAREESVGTFN